jgi:Asp-tRNA(Asn)/Glu-tRNA(Gln) amidotransferase A subunit family amidase
MLLGGVGAGSLRDRLRAGDLTCTEVARALLDAAVPDRLRAWETLDPARLLLDAAALDALPSAERDLSPLFGVPVGVKDNFDTVEEPTTYGSPIYAGHRPSGDAAVVRRLRAAGALIAGKMKLAEFAWMHPSDTVNPIDPHRTPGGSSSGSAAAVAAGLVPLATGTQTAGSVIRPASYCGVVGFKPTFGEVPRDGVKLLSPTLDTVGWFARSAADIVLLFDALVGAEPMPVVGSPRLAFAQTSLWDHVEADAQRAIERSVAELPGVESLDPIPGYAELTSAQTTIQLYESAQSLAAELADAPQLLSDELREALERGAKIPAAGYEDAVRSAARLRPAVIERLSRYDAVVTPSATGVPPAGLAFTGDPLFCRAWTLIGAPCLSLPLAWTAAQLPVGVQLVAAPGQDRRLLATALTVTGTT